MLTDADKDMIFDANPDALLADGFEDAYIGLCNRFGQAPLAAYSYDKCLGILMERDGMTFDEAVDFFSFNVIGAWVGEGTPVFIERGFVHAEY